VAVAVAALKSPFSLLALVLLLVAALRHYGWAWFPDDLRGVASKGLGGVEVLALLSVAWWLIQARAVRVVLVLWAAHEALVVTCSAWWMVSPWVVPKGQPMCSSGIGFDLGAPGILAVLLVAVWITREKAE
jgi:hypothetical protein